MVGRAITDPAASTVPIRTLRFACSAPGGPTCEWSRPALKISFFVSGGSSAAPFGGFAKT